MKLDKQAVKRFFAMMRERESIRLKKAAGQPYPWTDDPILGAYKFTNVKRTDDRTTRLLVEEFYSRISVKTQADRRVALLNCAVARYFGTIEFMRAIGWQQYFRPDHLKKIARQRLDAGERVYTGAYMISPCNREGPKEKVVVDIFLRDLWMQADLVCNAVYFHTWEKFVSALSQVEGFGGTLFMSKEVSLDCRLIPGFFPRSLNDLMTWTPVGPGSKRGAARLLGDTSAKPLNGRNTLEVCREVFKIKEDYLPPDFVELELHDIQFASCEYDKYERVRLGQGRPRSRYRPSEAA